jgi:hypothetical protein
MVPTAAGFSERQNRERAIMEKLVARYIADPSAKNLARIRKHLHKHPMSGLTLSLEETATLRAAGLNI